MLGVAWQLGHKGRKGKMREKKKKIGKEGDERKEKKGTGLCDNGSCQKSAPVQSTIMVYGIIYGFSLACTLQSIVTKTAPK